MRIEALGDAGWVVRDFECPAYVLAEQLRLAGLPGVVDVAASYETVGIYCEPGALDDASLTAEIDDLGSRISNLGSWLVEPRRHEIPVCYETGEDSGEICEQLGLGFSELVELHTSREYVCFAVGFCPGFGYLGWLPDRLAGLPRRPTPRTRVTAGSVGITGRQTAVYPLERPGGWALIGRTPLVLVDVADHYFPMSAGDRVRFSSIQPDEFEKLKGTRL